MGRRVQRRDPHLRDRRRADRARRRRRDHRRQRADARVARVPAQGGAAARARPVPTRRPAAAPAAAGRRGSVAAAACSRRSSAMDGCPVRLGRPPGPARPVLPRAVRRGAAGRSRRAGARRGRAVTVGPRGAARSWSHPTARVAVTVRRGAGAGPRTAAAGRHPAARAGLWRHKWADRRAPAAERGGPPSRCSSAPTARCSRPSRGNVFLVERRRDAGHRRRCATTCCPA